MKVLKVNKEQIKQIEKGYREYLPSTHDFDPREFMQRLSEYFDKDTSEIEEAFFKEDAYIGSLYPVTISTLEEFFGNYTLGIFSEGVFGNQMAKLTQSGIVKYFDQNNIYIFRRKRENSSVEQLPKEAFLIDDKPEVLEVINNKTNIDCIWINRIDKKPHSKFKTVFNLNELNKFIC